MKKFIFIVLIVASGACGDGATEEPLPGDPLFVRDPVLDVALVSARGGATSHNVGENCMRCHQAHGPGPGRFTAAGTLRNPDGSPHPNGTLVLTRQDPSMVAGGGETVATIEADALGNFFTTAALPLPNESLWTLVRSADGTSQNAMGWPTITAACNACHVGRNILTVRKAF
jgi:hypothetical protein